MLKKKLVYDPSEPPQSATTPEAVECYRCGKPMRSKGITDFQGDSVELWQCACGGVTWAFAPASQSAGKEPPNEFTELDAGHDFLLRSLDGSQPQRLTFVKRVGTKFPGNTTAYPGTTSQECMRAVIRRAIYVDGQDAHPVNSAIIQRERQNIYELEQRAAERHGRTLLLSPEQISHIEEMPTCPECGHILPETHKDCAASPEIERPQEPPKFVQLCAVPEGPGHPFAMFALDAEGQVWRYEFRIRSDGAGRMVWVAVTKERERP